MRVTEIDLLPAKPGVYFLYKGEDCVYVGGSANVRKRLSSHQHRNKCDSIEFIPCKVGEINQLEKFHIENLKPPLNRQLVPCTSRRRRRTIGGEVISTRIDQDSVRKIQELADGEVRSFGNMLRVLIHEAIEIHVAKRGC